MILKCCNCGADWKRLYREAAVFSPKIFCQPCGELRKDRVDLVPAIRDTADGLMWQLTCIPPSGMRSWETLPS